MPILPIFCPATQGFLELALKTEQDECLLWPFRKGRGKPQGRDVAFNKLYSLHRILCEMAHGPPATPCSYALHSFNNDRCLNKHHIYWSTRLHITDNHESFINLAVHSFTDQCIEWPPTESRWVRSLVGDWLYTKTCSPTCVRDCS